MEFTKKKKTRRGGKGKRKGMAPGGPIAQIVDPQPMAGSVDPLARKAKLAAVLKAKGAGTPSPGGASALTQSKTAEP